MYSKFLVKDRFLLMLNFFNILNVKEIFGYFNCWIDYVICKVINEYM